jgi:hypothetical protein
MMTLLFVALGRLCSLVFMRRIKDSSDMYTAEVQFAIVVFQRKLHYYDQNCSIVGHTSYVKNPKAHLLNHLHEDIPVHGCPLGYETESGEMFNKHVREHLCHTNRLDTSYDLAIEFGKQEIMGLLLGGGFWFDKDEKLNQAGKCLERFVDEYQPAFQQYFMGGMRVFSDNNSIGGDPVVGKFGFFFIRNSRFDTFP